MMGINVEITSIDTANNSVAFNQDGASKTAIVVAPAQIKWAKMGKAEVVINGEGKISFLKSLEPKPIQNKPEGKIIPISTAREMEGVTLTEFTAVYNNINATQNTKCGASTLFRREDGNYDAVLYITTFVPKDSVLADKTVAN